MKVAVVTDDGKTITGRMGRAPYCLVFNIEGGQIVGREQRDSAGFHHTVDEPHDHDSADVHYGHDEHGQDAHSEAKHARMVETIRDCEAIIVQEKLCGAYLTLQQANIRPYVSPCVDAEEAVQAYINGELREYTEWLGACF